MERVSMRNCPPFRLKGRARLDSLLTAPTLLNLSSATHTSVAVSRAVARPWKHPLRRYRSRVGTPGCHDTASGQRCSRAQESSRTMAPEPAQGQDNRPNISGRRAELFSAATDTGGDAIPQMAVVSTHGVHTQRTKMSSTTGEELIFTATQAIRHGPDGFTRTRKPARTVILTAAPPILFFRNFADRVDSADFADRCGF